MEKIDLDKFNDKAKPTLMWCILETIKEFEKNNELPKNKFDSPALILSIIDKYWGDEISEIIDQESKNFYTYSDTPTFLHYKKLILKQAEISKIS